MTEKLIVIVDAGFSWRVANLTRELGYEAVHVDAVSGLRYNDRLIWKLAEEKTAIVLTKDNGFLELSKNAAQAKLLLYVGYNSKQSRIMKELKMLLPAALHQLSNDEMVVCIP